VFQLVNFPSYILGTGMFALNILEAETQNSHLPLASIGTFEKNAKNYFPFYILLDAMESFVFRGVSQGDEQS